MQVWTEDLCRVCGSGFLGLGGLLVSQSHGLSVYESVSGSVNLIADPTAYLLSNLLVSHSVDLTFSEVCLSVCPSVF